MLDNMTSNGIYDVDADGTTFPNSFNEDFSGQNVKSSISARL